MRIEGLREIAGRFDGMLIDQFGVIHDGQRLYPGTLGVMEALHAAGVPVVVMTNSGKRAEANRQRVIKMGLSRELFVDAVSSGEIAYQQLILAERNRPPNESWGPLNHLPPETVLGDANFRWHDGVRKAFIIGKDGEDYGFDELNIVADPQDADVLLILGSDAPATSLNQYSELLQGLSMPAICCNPDRLMLTPQGMQPAPGAIAALYEQMGRQVTWIGKPYPEIYHHAVSLIGNPERVLCIGDSAEHDVAGGRAAGLATLLVRTGVSAGLDIFDPEPDYLMDAFIW